MEEGLGLYDSHSRVLADRLRCEYCTCEYFFVKDILYKKEKKTIITCSGCKRRRMIDRKLFKEMYKEGR
jgi:hypothetical protein